MLGRTISHYRVVSQLGAGGMGVVYAAEDVRLGRPVALKFVPEDLARDRQALERFRVEARAASALNHANICTIHDIGEDGGRPFIVMELMKGQTLRDRLAASPPLKIHQIVDIGIQIADALDAAHSQGIVHRDIKPANLFVAERGQVKILDFGLAKLAPAGGLTEATRAATTSDQLTVPGVTLGTVAYMSPEQAAGEELDGRTDLFSLGVVLYECATGHRPFTGNTAAVILAAILNRAPVAPAMFNPDLPLRLQEVVNNCLEKDRELRYQTAADLRADLKRVKRDLESGRSDAVMVSANPLTDPAVAAEWESGSRPVRSRRASGSVPAAQPTPTASVSGRRPRGLLAAGAIAVVALGAAGVSSVFWPADEPPVEFTGPTESAASVVESRAGQARASLEAGHYRSALIHADEVLASAPDHEEAAVIRDEARRMLDRFDAAIVEARRLMGAGDLEAAARPLATARDIDPVAPEVAELSALLAGQIEARTRQAQQEFQRSRVAIASRPAVRPGASGEPGSTEPQDVPVQSVATEPSPPSPQPSPATKPAAATTPPPMQRPSQAPPTAPPPIGQPTMPAVPPATAPVERAEREPAPTVTPPAEDDESAIRRVLSTYERAIETKDVALFRSVKPSLTREEEQRIEEGFRAVSSQDVSITILSIERQEQGASVRLRRRDTIDVGGRRQTSESQQTMTLVRTGNGWVIVEIGR